MTGFDSDDPTDRAARDAAAVFHGESLTGAPLPRSDRPRPRPATTTAPRRRALDHSLTSPPSARARRRGGAMVGVHDARAPPPPSRRALGRRERLLDLGTSFVRIRRDETRHAAPNPRVVEPTPPLPALPLGASIVPIAQLAHIGACASDLRTLWSRSRARVQKPRDDADDELASATRERRRPFRSDDPSVDANLAHDRRGSDPGCFDRFGRSGRPGSSPALRDAPVVPLALVGRLRLPPSDSVSEGVFSDSRTPQGGRASRASAFPTRARARSSRRRHRVASSSRRRRGGGGVFRGFGRGPDETENGDSDGGAGGRARPRASARAEGGFDAVGAVVAVSPAITLRGEDGAAPARFFMAELARCPRCGRGPADGGGDVARRIMFKGESSATWRPFRARRRGASSATWSRAPRPEYRAGPRAGACG